MNASRTAARDQIAAADRDTQTAAAVLAALVPDVTDTCPRPLAHTITGHWLAALDRGAPVCPHPARVRWWNVSRPVLLACPACAVTGLAAIHDNLCDECLMPAPLAGIAVALPGLLGRHRATGAVVAIPPVIALGAVCRLCWGAP